MELKSDLETAQLRATRTHKEWCEHDSGRRAQIISLLENIEMFHQVNEDSNPALCKFFPKRNTEDKPRMHDPREPDIAEPVFKRARIPALDGVMAVGESADSKVTVMPRLSTPSR